MRLLTRGVAAGLVGTAALNMTTYADMVLRGRPSSSVPAHVVGELANRAGIELGPEPGAANRRDAMGALLGYAAGVGVAMAYALATRWRRTPRSPWVAGPLLGAAAMSVSDLPAIRLGATDPADWGASGWMSDIVPHALYGLATVTALNAFQGERE